MKNTFLILIAMTLGFASWARAQNNQAPQCIQPNTADKKIAELEAVFKNPVANGVTFQLSSFTSDGCSMFPDGTPTSPNLWYQCCFIHDVAYWQGGTSQQRADADMALCECVAKVAGKFMGEWMYSGVRMGGAAITPTPWRWGYGWTAKDSDVAVRPYKALTPIEREEVSRLVTPEIAPYMK